MNEVSCRKNKTATPYCIISDGVKHMDKQSVATVLNRHFASIGQFLANKLPKLPSTAVASVFNCMNKSNVTFSLQHIDETFVLNQLNSLKTNKSIGLDKISARLLKDAASAISPSLTKLFNLSVSCHSFPTIWKSSKVIPIFKSGERTDPSNFNTVRFQYCQL